MTAAQPPVEPQDAVEPAEGWAFPTMSARKCHYFSRDRRSLCGRYGSFGLHLQPDNGRPSRDDCATCRRKLEARDAV